MSHIAVDLKVIETHAPAVARATEQPVTHIIGALNLLWHRCWVNKTDTITRVGLAGIFGPARLDETIASLVDTHFLEPLADGWRVRGAEKYLRVTDAKSAAGKVRAGSAGRSAGRFTSTSPADHQHTTSSQPALTPSTEHRTPSTEKEEEAPPPPIPVAAFEIVAPDMALIESWPKEAFWRAAELTRRARGYPPQKWPNPVTLSRWWGEARAIADVTTLAKAFTRFADDSYWGSRTPPAPFAGFMTEWNNFLPSRAA